jgi:hypothetical protein
MITQRLCKEERFGSAIFQAIFSTTVCDLAAFGRKIKGGDISSHRQGSESSYSSIGMTISGPLFYIVGPTRSLTAIVIRPVLLILDGLDECKDVQEQDCLPHTLVRELESHEFSHPHFCSVRARYRGCILWPQWSPLARSDEQVRH